MRKLEPLTKLHDRDGFDCGSEPLNLFLKQMAHQHAKRSISRTLVLVDEGSPIPIPILGFFSLNLCQVSPASLPDALAKSLPREICGVKLGRLAVARSHQKQGIGKALVFAAVVECSEILKRAGGIGFFVDAKDQGAKRFYELFGFTTLPSEALKLFMPVRTVQEALKS